MSDRPARRAAADAYDAMIAADHPLCRGATDAELADPIGTIDPARWMGPIAGRRVLCLAAGGGRHSVLYAAAGADVTVVDISPGMLDGDRRELSRRGLTGVRLIRGDMTDLSTLADASFDLVVQPVSTCYVPDVRPVYREVARVLRGDGIYVSQHKTPTNLQTSLRCNRRNRYEIEHPYREGIRIETADRGPAASRLQKLDRARFPQTRGGRSRTGRLASAGIGRDRVSASLGSPARRSVPKWFCHHRCDGARTPRPRCGGGNVRAPGRFDRPVRPHPRRSQRGWFDPDVALNLARPKIRRWRVNHFRGQRPIDRRSGRPRFARPIVRRLRCDRLFH